MDIAGKVFIVTGGASGLGEGSARMLAREGGKVVIADLQVDKGEALAKELGGGAKFVEADVTDAEQVANAVAIAGENAPLRIAGNIAGVGDANRTVSRDGTPADLDRFKRVININLIGTFNVLRLAAAAMSKTDPTEAGERGVIVNTASVAAFDGQIGQIAYSASKGGVVGMTLPAARDLSPTGIRVCTVAPGLFDTPLLAMLPQEARDALGAGVPFPRRLGGPAEFAALVVHICENGYLNGEVIRLDGALRMPPK
ncbi:MAG TPA: SDR family NAD(P)-dependent oxidoreductase [Burkholderiaceae bacterium]|nr:SDR family NAD(P)-dependent oxidoreductase [Burkholderiaceae bacterium]